MNQQAPDLPRSVQIISRYKSLIGFAALLGAMAGILLAVLNPVSSSSSGQVTAVFTAPMCPAGAICGGPMFTPAFFEAMLAKEFPTGVTVKPVDGNTLSISVAGQTVAQAQALATNVANSFMGTTSTMAPGLQINQPATTAATTPVKRAEGYTLLGALAGVLLGVIAALAAGQTIIDSPTLPRGLGIGTADGQAGQPVRYATDSRAVQQLARESTLGKGSPFGG